MPESSRELTELIERLDALLLTSGYALSDTTAQPTSIWIVDTDQAKRSATLLRRSLAFLGILSTRQMTVDELDSIDIEKQRRGELFVVSLSFTGEPTNQNILIEKWCTEASVPWMRAVIDSASGYADAGPIFLSGRTPCYKCFAQLHLGELESSIRSLPHCSIMAFWCNMFAPLLAALYRQIKSPYMPDGFRRFDLKTLQGHHLRRALLPNCTCRQLSPGVKPYPEHVTTPEIADCTALAYEDSIGNEHPSHASHSIAKNFVSRSLTLKAFPNSSSITLGSPSPVGDIGVAELLEVKASRRIYPLTLEDLTAILSYSVGLRSIDMSRSGASRWTASAGNLGSPELFVFANGVQGLDPGLYHYRAIAHDLVDLDFRSTTSWRDRHSSLLEDDALLCFAGSYHRLQQKYGAFGYRLVHLDAGAAYSQASLIARSLGADLTLVMDIDELYLTNCLNLSPMREQLTAVASLSTARLARSSELAHLSEATRPSAGTRRSLRFLGGLPSHRLAEELYWESMALPPVRTPGGERITPERREFTNHDEGLALEPIDGLRMPNVLRNRVSVRRFTQQELPRHSLTAMVRAACETDAAEWPQEHSQGRDLHFFLLESNMDDQKTLYEYHHSDASLRPIKVMSSFSTVPSLYVDPCFQDVPAAIWIVGNLEEAIRAHDNRGHRQLLFRSGAAANRLSLTAISLGIAGTICAGLLPRIARQLLSFDGWTRLPFCAFLAGLNSGLSQ